MDNICDRVSTQSKKLKDAILVAFDRENVGWKMVYNFLGIDEKKHAEISTYFCLKHRSGKKSAIFRTVYPKRNHVTTHPVNAL